MHRGHGLYIPSSQLVNVVQEMELRFRELFPIYMHCAALCKGIFSVITRRGSFLRYGTTQKMEFPKCKFSSFSCLNLRLKYRDHVILNTGNC